VNVISRSWPQDRKPDSVIWMFAGQGAQYFQMGRELFTRHPTFRSSMLRMEEALLPYLDQPITAILYNDAVKIGDRFDQLTDTHPALFMVQIALAETLLAEGMPKPDLLLGVSLGEYVAAAVSGAAPPEDLLPVLLRQAWTFQSKAEPGAMLMVLDDPAHFETDAIYHRRGTDFAGAVFDRCFVVSGPSNSIDDIIKDLRARDISHHLLPVRYAFHGSGIEDLEAPFRAAMRSCKWGAGQIPVISASDGTGQVIDPAERDWWKVVRGPIHLHETLQALSAQYPKASYIDCGPAGNLRTACVHGLGNEMRTRSFAVVTPFGTDMQNLKALKQNLGERV
jgi:acyl transferase domain-containing protein